MRYEKKVLAELEKCYALAPLRYQGEDCFLVAAEKHDRCLLFHGDGRLMDTVWTGPGGVMTMEQIPDGGGAFLATQAFYSPNDSAEAKLVLALPGACGWQVRVVAELPFVHRFTILRAWGEQYVIAATLKSAHAYKDDWTCPGRVWAAKLPRDLAALGVSQTLQFTAIKSGLLRNHGFFKDCGPRGEGVLIGSESGIFRVAPDKAEDTWRVDCLLDAPASDMALLDLDGDGTEELVVYAPFHGEELSVYRPCPKGYELIYRHPEPLEFLHAICAGAPEGLPTLLVGYRKGDRALRALTYRDGYKLDFIDRGAGPANAIFLPDGKTIVAANRESDEIAMYLPLP